MEKRNLPNVGDVITSTKFALGYYDDKNKKIIIVDGNIKTYPRRFSSNKDVWAVFATKSGKIPNNVRTEELCAYDPSRATARFVVEVAEIRGGSTGHWSDEIYPDGWCIIARRLRKNGNYNPKGETVGFYMTGCFPCMVAPRDVKIIGKKKMRFL